MVDMLLTVTLVGIAFLVGLAVAIGVESGSYRNGRRGIAAARRELAERSRQLDEREEGLAVEGRELYEWEGQLIRAAECGGCPICELRRLRGERPAS
ncbi:hypothetical protein ACQPZA_35045 [Pseudonocardia xinjiangensis]|uniref:hypothetical protein n=1 Tax=Pseudonocardia xinjiangensis TaxID=75289 RepID=UPI003D91E20B